MTSVGRYYRFGLHQERKRFRAVLPQRSDEGRPTYFIDADWTDQTRIAMRQTQRFAQATQPNAADGDVWKLAENPGDLTNNFLILGGNNTVEGAGRAFVGGFEATLYQDTDYECKIGGAFDPALADEIHHRLTSVEAGRLIDEHALYTDNVLVGLRLRVNLGAGGTSFAVVSNTATIINLAGFDPITNPPVDNFYFIEQATSAIDEAHPVYLDVHLEDWGILEDSDLNHNPGGSPLEAARRLKLIQWVRVHQNPERGPVAPVTDYIDVRGAQHYVFGIGTINRDAGDPNIENGDIDDSIGNVPINRILGGDDAITAREFSDVAPCVPPGDQPKSLKERVDRQASMITVGPDPANPTGMYNGPAGLILALNCGRNTIFVKNGTYIFSGLGTLTIPSDRTLIAESRGVLFILDQAADPGMSIGAHSIVEGFSFTHSILAAGPVARLNSNRGRLLRCFIIDLNPSDPTILVSGAAPFGVEVAYNQIVKTGGAGAIEISPTGPGYNDVDQAPDTSGTNSVVGIDVHSNQVTCRGLPLNNFISAVKITDGWAVNFHRNTVFGDGNLFSHQAVSADPDSPLVYTGRDSILCRDNLFVFEAKSGASTETSTIRLLGGHGTFSENVVEAQTAASDAPTKLPKSCVQVLDLGSQLCSYRIEHNLLRGAREGIRYQLVDFGELAIIGNHIKPHLVGFDLNHGIVGNTGLSSFNNFAGGEILIAGNYVKGSAGTLSHIFVGGHCTVEGNSIDGSLNTQRAIDLKEGVLESSESHGIVTGHVAVNGVIIIRNNQIHKPGNAGIVIDGVSVIPLVVEGNQILNGTRGISIEDLQASVEIRDNVINFARYEGIVALHVSNVIGNQLFACGSAAGVNPNLASIRGGRIVQGNRISAAAMTGISIESNGAIVEGNIITDCAQTGIFIGASTVKKCEVLRNTLKNCQGGFVGSNLDHGRIAFNEIRECPSSNPIEVRDSSAIVISHNVISQPLSNASAAVQLSGCDHPRITENVITLGGNLSHIGIELVNCAFPRVTHNKLNARQDTGGGIVLDGTTEGAEVTHNHIECGSPVSNPDIVSSRSIAIYGPPVNPINGPVRVYDNFAKYGMAVSGGAGVFIHGNQTQVLGIWADGGAGTISVKDNEVNVSGIAKDFVSLTGIFIGSVTTNFDTAHNKLHGPSAHLVAIENNLITIGGVVGVGPDISVDIAERSAGIRVMSSFADILNNSIHAPSIGIQLGWFKESGTLVGVDMGVIAGNIIQPGPGWFFPPLNTPRILIICQAGGVSMVLKNNIILLRQDGESCVYIYRELGGSNESEVLFRGNEAAQRFVPNSPADATLWGVLHRAALVDMFYGAKEDLAAGGVVVRTIIENTNMFTKGADL